MRLNFPIENLARIVPRYLRDSQDRKGRGVQAGLLLQKFSRRARCFFPRYKEAELIVSPGAGTVHSVQFLSDHLIYAVEVDPVSEDFKNRLFRPTI